MPDQIMEGEQGWAMQGVLSRASFRRAAGSQWSEVLYCVVPAHQQHLRQEKSIAKKIIQTIRAIMISQDINLVAGDFNGTAWRCRSRDNLSTIDEVFADCALPTPPVPTPLWDLDPSRTVGSQRFWKVNKHGVFSIPRKSLGLRPTDQSCHHETWSHLDFVDWSNTWSKQNAYEPRISLQERPAHSAYWNPKRRISEIMSDNSLSL